MFARRPELAAAMPAQAGSTRGLAGLELGALANPAVGAAGAGVLLLIATIGAIALIGDPRAGAPRVRISLAQPAADAAAALAAAPVGPNQALISLGDQSALPAAPIAGLTAPGPGGLLPIIAADGRTPSDAYARPFRDNGAPKVALVIGGLGLNAKATRDAIEQLPAEVTLSFVPYADGLQGWIDLARQHGHEVLLETPMEPVDYPQNDPGPYTLMANDPAPETTKRMEWLLSRATGYFGVTNYLGGKFLASDPAMGVFTANLRKRGLAFLDDGSAAGRGPGVPRASADRVIDENLDGGSITQELAGLEDSARQRGRALGSGFAYPVTLQQVQQWASGLGGRGLVLAPASAVTGRR